MIQVPPRPPSPYESLIMDPTLPPAPTGQGTAGKRPDPLTLAMLAKGQAQGQPQGGMSPFGMLGQMAAGGGGGAAPAGGATAAAAPATPAAGAGILPYAGAAAAIPASGYAVNETMIKPVAKSFRKDGLSAIPKFGERVFVDPFVKGGKAVGDFFSNLF